MCFILQVILLLTCCCQNPRHTWQSWRNHFVKALQSLDHHDLKMLAATAPDEDLTQGPPPEQKSAAIVTPKPEHAVVRSSRVAAAEESAPVPPSQGGRTEFSEQDDAIIATWAVGHSMVLTTNHFKELEEEVCTTFGGWKSELTMES